MTPQTVTDTVLEIETLMSERLRLRAGPLARQIRKAGRQLPRRVAREARFLAEAGALANHPKMARQVDPARLESARRTVTDYLTAIDPAKQRTDRLLRFLAALALNFLALGVLVVAVLRWRGLV